MKRQKKRVVILFYIFLKNTVDSSKTNQKRPLLADDIALGVQEHTGTKLIALDPRLWAQRRKLIQWSFTDDKFKIFSRNDEKTMSKADIPPKLRPPHQPLFLLPHRWV